jgi:DNA adenine methylase
MKTLFPYYGGKSLMLPHIMGRIPPHQKYVEPFFGSGAVFFAKPSARESVINDADRNLINLYRTIITDYDALKKEVDASLAHNGLFFQAKYICNYYDRVLDGTWRNDIGKKMFSVEHILQNIPPIDRAAPHVMLAWAAYYVYNMSFSAISTSNSFLYHSNMNYKKSLFTKDVRNKLENALLLCDDALRILKTNNDGSDTFAFIDPPYIGTDNRGYKHTCDMDALLRYLGEECKTKFMLTIFDCPQINEFVARYKLNVTRIEKKIACSALCKIKDDKKSRTELLITNYEYHNLFDL